MLLFNDILREENLKVDREGQRRTAYSLRHTYICLRLMEGADIYQVAKNYRTSVKMIEQFYASHIKNQLSAAAINVKRPPRTLDQLRPAEAPRAPRQHPKRTNKRPSSASGYRRPRRATGLA